MAQQESIELLKRLGTPVDEDGDLEQNATNRDDCRPRRVLLLFIGLIALFLLWPNRSRRAAATTPVGERRPWHRHNYRGSPPSSFQGPANREFSTPRDREPLTGIYADMERRFRNPQHAPLACRIGLEHRARYRALTGGRRNVLFVASYSNSENVLQTVLHEVTALVSFLGPRTVHVAITEGGSTDESPALLHLLARALTSIGASFSIRCAGDTERSAWDRQDERIKILADARNWPLDHLEGSVAQAMDGFDAVLMFNDVTFCAVDALELLYQQLALDADMVCGLDYNRWNWVGSRPLAFYDTCTRQPLYSEFALVSCPTGVARTMEGKTFWDITPSGNFYDGSLDFEHGLLATSPSAQSRYRALEPFQVFSCWNGGLAVRAEPLQNPYRIRLRPLPTQQVSESFVFNQDLWSAGFGRVAVAPRARFAYSKEDYELIGMLNITEGIATPSMQHESNIDWQERPPDLVEFYDEHSFWTPAMRPWNWLPNGVRT